VGKIKPNAFGVSLCKVTNSHIPNKILFHFKITFSLCFSKGFYINQLGNVDLISNMIKDLLNIDCLVLMGANIANEVAAGNFCEATIGKFENLFYQLFKTNIKCKTNQGSKSLENGLLLKEALQTNYFRIVVVQDAEVVESCCALKVNQSEPRVAFFILTLIDLFLLECGRSRCWLLRRS